MRNTTTHLGGMAKGSFSNGISGEQPAHDRLGETYRNSDFAGGKESVPKNQPIPAGS
jgi:hypothetical protein